MSELNKNNLAFALMDADRIEQMLIESGGEITSEIDQALVVSEKNIGESVDREIQKIERIEHVMQVYKKKADQFKMIADSMKLFVERREEQIKEYMLATGKETLSGQEYEYFLAKPSISTDVFDKIMVPDEFVEITRKPKKDEIKEALKSGIQVPGARLIENRSLRTRIYRGRK